MVFTELTNITFTYLLSLIKLVIYLTIWYNIISLQNKEVFSAVIACWLFSQPFPGIEAAVWGQTGAAECIWHSYAQVSCLPYYFLMWCLLPYGWAAVSLDAFLCENLSVCFCFKASSVGINPNNQMMLFPVIRNPRKLLTGTHQCNTW